MNKLIVAALPAILSVPTSAQTTLVSTGSVWRYLDDGSDLGTTWRAPSFDDSSWAAGPAQLGYGDGDEATVVSYGPDPSFKHITTYFRHNFQVADASQFEALTFKLLRDAAAVVYLNGHEVYRSNIVGPIDYLTLAVVTVSPLQENVYYDRTIDATHLVMGTNTLAVEIHQRSRASLDISLDLRLDGHTEPIAARGPFLQDAQPTSVRVRWRGVPASDGRVRYGTSPANLTSSMLDPTVAEDHEVLLPGLTPETRYYYAVGSSAMDLAGGDSEHFFETPPTVGSSTPLRFWVLGDSGTANRDARDVRDAYESFTGATYTNAIVLLGDNAYERSGEEELQTAVFDMYGDALRQSPAYPTRGNHEAVAAVYFDAYTMPAGGVPSGTEAYYSFDYGNVHFLCLDSQGSDRAVDGPMWLWARDDLTATDQPWIVAFWHHPPYSKGNHDSDTEASLVQMRENFLPLLEDHAVDLVLGGHSHSYERSFLVDGHYGDSTTLTNNMRVDDGDGRPDGDGAYNKAAGPRAGAVYITAGSSGKITNAAFGHPIMVHSRALLGSVVLDVDGGRMDVKFLDAQGLVDDSFTMLGEDYVGVYCVASVNSYGCTADVTTLGTPSVSSPSAFTLTASNLPPKSFAFLVYSTAPENTPGLFGRVCVDRPLRRRLATFTQGPAPCGGRAEIDFNETIQAGFDPGLVVGTTIYSQFWYRDRLPQGAAVSEAYQFTIQP